MKINSPVNYNGADFNVVTVAGNGDVVLRPTCKHLENVTVEKPYVKHIHRGYYKSRRSKLKF